MTRLSASMLVLLVLAFAPAATIAGDNPVEKKQYLYRLQLIPRLVDESNWTDKDNKIVGDHFERLKGLLADGTLVLAGRTLNTDETAFGIVILEAGSDEEARALMEGDPAVSEGIMTAELFPYRVALIRTEAAE
jgi:uncharacterized protein YciI